MKRAERIARDAKIVALLKEGKSQTEISEIFNLSSGRVSQIKADVGLGDNTDVVANVSSTMLTLRKALTATMKLVEEVNLSRIDRDDLVKINTLQKEVTRLRDLWIYRSHLQGTPQHVIADLLDLSPGRISQIFKLMREEFDGRGI